MRVFVWNIINDNISSGVGVAENDSVCVCVCLCVGYQAVCLLFHGHVLFPLYFRSRTPLSLTSSFWVLTSSVPWHMSLCCYCRDLDVVHCSGWRRYRNQYVFDYSVVFFTLRASEAAKQNIVFGPTHPSVSVSVCQRNKWKTDRNNWCRYTLC